MSQIQRQSTFSKSASKPAAPPPAKIEIAEKSYSPKPKQINRFNTIDPTLDFPKDEKS